jgi:hypothetical protein
MPVLPRAIRLRFVCPPVCPRTNKLVKPQKQPLASCLPLRHLHWLLNAVNAANPAEQRGFCLAGWPGRRRAREPVSASFCKSAGNRRETRFRRPSVRSSVRAASRLGLLEALTGLSPCPPCTASRAGGLSATSVPSLSLNFVGPLSRCSGEHPHAWYRVPAGFVRSGFCSDRASLDCATCAPPTDLLTRLILTLTQAVLTTRLD